MEGRKGGGGQKEAGGNMTGAARVLVNPEKLEALRRMEKRRIETTTRGRAGKEIGLGEGGLDKGKDRLICSGGPLLQMRALRIFHPGGKGMD